MKEGWFVIAYLYIISALEVIIGFVTTATEEFAKCQYWHYFAVIYVKNKSVFFLKVITK